MGGGQYKDGNFSPLCSAEISLLRDTPLATLYFCCALLSFCEKKAKGFGWAEYFDTPQRKHMGLGCSFGQVLAIGFARGGCAGWRTYLGKVFDQRVLVVGWLVDFVQTLLNKMGGWFVVCELRSSMHIKMGIALTLQRSVAALNL